LLPPLSTTRRAHRISHTTFAALNLTQKARALAASKKKKNKKERKIGKGEARKRMSEYKRAAEPATTTRSELGPAAV